MSDTQVKTKKLFEKENRLYKYYINSIETSEAGTDFIKALFKLELIDSDKSKNQDLVQLYEILGFDKFFEFVAFFGTRTVKVPKVDKIKRLLIVAIAYYQTVILGLSPKDAGRILSKKLGIFNLKQKSIKSIVRELQQAIDHVAEKAGIMDKTLKEELEAEKARVENCDDDYDEENIDSEDEEF